MEDEGTRDASLGTGQLVTPLEIWEWVYSAISIVTCAGEWSRGCVVEVVAQGKRPSPGRQVVLRTLWISGNGLSLLALSLLYCVLAVRLMCIVTLSPSDLRVTRSTHGCGGVHMCLEFWSHTPTNTRVTNTSFAQPLAVPPREGRQSHVICNSVPACSIQRIKGSVPTDRWFFIIFPHLGVCTACATTRKGYRLAGVLVEQGTYAYDGQEREKQELCKSTK